MDTTKELSYSEALTMSFRYSKVLCAGSGIDGAIDHALTEWEVYEGVTHCPLVVLASKKKFGLKGKDIYILS